MATDKVAILFCSNGEDRAMAKIQPDSSWNLPPTDRQTRAITMLYIQLGIREPLEERPCNRLEARSLQYELMQARRLKRR